MSVIGNPKENKFVFHRDQGFNVTFERTYENVREYLLNSFIEGFVIEYEGKCWKIRSNVFDKNCKYEQLKKNLNTKIN